MFNKELKSDLKYLNQRYEELLSTAMDYQRRYEEATKDIARYMKQNEALLEAVKEKDTMILSLKTYINTLEIRLHYKDQGHRVEEENPVDVSVKYLKKYFNMHLNNNWFGCCDSDTSRIPAIKNIREFLIPGFMLTLRLSKGLNDALFDNDIERFISVYEDGILRNDCLDYHEFAKIIKEKNLMEI